MSTQVATPPAKKHEPPAASSQPPAASPSVMRLYRVKVNSPLAMFKAFNTKAASAEDARIGFCRAARLPIDGWEKGVLEVEEK